LQTDSTNLQKPNECYYTLQGYPISLILYWVIAQLQHWIQQGNIGMQTTTLKFKQPNLG